MVTQVSSRQMNREFFLNAAAGNVPGVSVIRKFGRRTVTTSYEPIALQGVYMMPQSAEQLRIAPGDAADNPSGSGARSVRIQGLNAAGEFTQETLATNGAAAGSASTNSYLRLFRAWVETSGTYASGNTGSHVGDIDIESAGSPTELWLRISSGGYPKAQSSVACYTIPLGLTGLITHMLISNDDTNDVDVLLMQRRNILQSAAPYNAMRKVIELDNIHTAVDIRPEPPYGPFPELTDLVFFGRAAAGTTVDVVFNIMLFNNSLIKIVPE